MNFGAPPAEAETRVQRILDQIEPILAGEHPAVIILALAQIHAAFAAEHWDDRNELLRTHCDLVPGLAQIQYYKRTETLGDTVKVVEEKP